MRLENVFVFNTWDLDGDKKTLIGLNLQVLNIADRIEFELGNERLVLEKGLFAKDDWFTELLQRIKDS